MFRSVRVLFAFFFSLAGAVEIGAQQPLQMASLHPASELHWQRTSPTQQHSDGPVLYQLVFSPGTPGTIAKFDTNTRHLVSSDISDVGGIVAIGSSGFTINVNTGIVTFAGGQTFPGTGTVTSVAATSGITGGPITGSGTLSLDTTFTNNLYSQLAAANTFTTGTQLVKTGAAGTVGLAVQGASAQTANLEEWRNNAGTAVASVSASGAFSGDGSKLTNLSGSQLTDGGINRQQIALLKWYAANQNNITYAVGTGPNAVAFDGANIWVTNSNPSNNVMKLRASDGALLGTFFTDTEPVGVAFDGANIWVASNADNNVDKLRASDGVLLGVFPAGTGPAAVAFDGANIWVANQLSNNVTKLRASDGVLQGTFAVGTRPSAVAFDGANIWVANEVSNNVSKLRASDGAVLGTFAVGSTPFAVAFDGANIWVANYSSNTVSKLRSSDGAVLGTFAVGTHPVGVAFDGATIWVTNFGSNSVSKLRASDGTVLGTFVVGSGPNAVAFDGANIWVANSGSNNVSKL